MTNAIDTKSPTYAAELAAKYVSLLELEKRLKADIVACENGLRVAGIMRAGRPLIAPTHTTIEARQAHAAHQRGESSEWIDAGERQYQRDRKRAARSRKAS